MGAALSPAPGTRLPGQPPSPWLGWWPRAKPKPLRQRWGPLFFPHLTDRDSVAGKPRDMPAVRRPGVKCTSPSLNTHKEPASPPGPFSSGQKADRETWVLAQLRHKQNPSSYQTGAPVEE